MEGCVFSIGCCFSSSFFCPEAVVDDGTFPMTAPPPAALLLTDTGDAPPAVSPLAFSTGLSRVLLEGLLASAGIWRK